MKGVLEKEPGHPLSVTNYLRGRGLSDLSRTQKAPSLSNREGKQAPATKRNFPFLPDPAAGSTHTRNNQGSDSGAARSRAPTHPYSPDLLSGAQLPPAGSQHPAGAVGGGAGSPTAPPPRPATKPTRGGPRARPSRPALPPPNGRPGTRQAGGSSAPGLASPAGPPRTDRPEKARLRRRAQRSAAQNSSVSFHRAAAAAVRAFCCHGFSRQPAKPDADAPPPGRASRCALGPAPPRQAPPRPAPPHPKLYVMTAS